MSQPTQISAINDFLTKCDSAANSDPQSLLEEAKSLLSNICAGLENQQLNMSIPCEIPPQKSHIEKACRGIGHDFNGILANVRGLVEITQMMEPNAPENVQNTFSKILSLVDRGHHATELVRMYGKVQSVVVRTMNLHQSVRRLLNDVKISLQLSTPLNYDCPENVFIEFDEVQFETLLTQLCKNALQAAWAKDIEPDIKIQLNQISESRLEISVSDNGKGIAAEVGDQVYVPFYSTKKAAEGLGLGLSIAKQIVMNHNGHIFYESDPETGTVFTCSLPVIVDS